jgi:hypothetical protein
MADDSEPGGVDGDDAGPATPAPGARYGLVAGILVGLVLLGLIVWLLVLRA